MCIRDRYQRRVRATMDTEECVAILKEGTEDILTGKEFKHSMISQWTKEIMDTCIRNLTAANKNYKYIISCTLLEKKGAGFHTATSAYWDNTSDTSCSYRWENKTIHCITTLFVIPV
eukprot:TRINITY_DN956_c0_g1_i4.p1 TRINITY_DN956_c0_g1~~TRINITY_DN956_c0_g1_i4.p1  ORF type:complete len:117 (-),score=10.11 TRINITY_DN956_c0_g1_i4:19-369(-)